VLAQIAYRPLVVYVDSLKYLYGRYPVFRAACVPGLTITPHNARPRQETPRHPGPNVTSTAARGQARPSRDGVRGYPQRDQKTR
jgi:hypothetical protein